MLSKADVIAIVIYLSKTWDFNDECDLASATRAVEEAMKELEIEERIVKTPKRK